MSNQKQLLRKILSVLIVLAVVASTWQTAFAAAFVTDQSYAPGNQGVFMPGGLSPDVIEVTKVNHKEMGWSPVRFNRPLLRIDYIADETGQLVLTGQTDQTDQDAQTTQTGQAPDIDLGSPTISMTYVFFVLRSSEARDWEDGDLSIWYLDQGTSTWQRCSTFAVNNGAGDTDEDDGSQETRVACVAPQYTLYGLGTPR